MSDKEDVKARIEKLARYAGVDQRPTSWPDMLPDQCGAWLKRSEVLDVLAASAPPATGGTPGETPHEPVAWLVTTAGKFGPRDFYVGKLGKIMAETDSKAVGRELVPLYAAPREGLAPSPDVPTTLRLGLTPEQHATWEMWCNRLGDPFEKESEIAWLIYGLAKRIVAIASSAPATLAGDVAAPRVDLGKLIEAGEAMADDLEKSHRLAVQTGCVMGCTNKKADAWRSAVASSRQPGTDGLGVESREAK